MRQPYAKTGLAALAVLHGQGLGVSKKWVGVCNDKVRVIKSADFVADGTSIKAVSACP